MEPEGYLRFVPSANLCLGADWLASCYRETIGCGFPAGAIKPAGDRRIGVVEVSPLDSRRKLVLVRRDDVEHLLVLSPTEETVIERNIRVNTDFSQILAETQTDETDQKK